MDAIQELAKAKRVAVAYRNVLGDPNDPKGRTGDQHLVWEDLEAHCGAFRLSCEARGPQDGELADKRTFFNEGKRSVWLRMRGMILRAASIPKLTRVSRGKKTDKSNPTTENPTT